MTINDRAKKLFIALEASTDGRKAAIAMIAQVLCVVVEDCAGVADHCAEVEAQWAKDVGVKAPGEGFAMAQKIGEEIRGLKEGKA